MAGKAVSKRSISLVVAVVLAALAALALMSYVQGAEARAVASGDPVDAYVARDKIPAGTLASSAIGSGSIVHQSVARKLLPDGAVTALSQIQGKAAASDIQKGQLIVTAGFTDPKQAKGGLLAIPSDRQAMSVEVDLPPGVAGFVQQGDTVSVLALNADKAAPNSPARVQFLLQDIQVLAVGQRVDTTDKNAKSTTPVGNGQSQATSKVLLTLAVSPVEAEKLAFAVLQGQVYFTLVPSGQAPAATPGRTSANLFS